MNLKDIFASKIRQRVIKALTETNRLPVMKLLSKVGGSFSGLSPHLKLLEDEGIIKSENHDPPKHPKTRSIILLNGNPRTQKLIEANQILDE